MALLLSGYTDHSGAQHPSAVLVYSNLRLQTDPPAGELTVCVYHDQSSYLMGKAPVDPPIQTAFTPTEIAMIAAQFGVVPYTILQQRAEYTGSQIVA